MHRTTRTLTLVAAATLVSAAALTTPARAAQINAGDLVVYRVGTGTATLGSTATAVFLDEYTPAGAFVQSIPLPTAANGTSLALTASGTATSEGQLERSPDGQYVTLTGYNAAPGTTAIAATASATTPRVIGIVGQDGVVNTSTGLTDAFSANNIRSAITSDGTNLYAVGANSGVVLTTVGASTSTAIATTTTNLRTVDIYGGQLYVSSSSGTTRVATVGAGVPTTTGQTISNLPGVSPASPYAFFLADLSADVAGLDTLYVADDGTGATAGLLKFSLVGGTWVANGNLTVTGGGLRGLTGAVEGNGNVDLFATTGGAIYSLVDATGYNAALSGSLNSIATAATNTAFRGIDFAPVAVPEPAAATALAALALVATRRRRI
jgi:hypothetical protein